MGNLHNTVVFTKIKYIFFCKSNRMTNKYYLNNILIVSPVVLNTVIGANRELHWWRLKPFNIFNKNPPPTSNKNNNVKTLKTINCHTEN